MIFMQNIKSNVQVQGSDYMLFQNRFVVILILFFKLFLFFFF